MIPFICHPSYWMLPRGAYQNTDVATGGDFLARSLSGHLPMENHLPDHGNYPAVQQFGKAGALVNDPVDIMMNARQVQAAGGGWGWGRNG